MRKGLGPNRDEGPSLPSSNRRVGIGIQETPAQDRVFRKKKCVELGSFPFGYFHCHYLGPPAAPFKYWPFFEGTYIQDPAYGGANTQPTGHYGDGETPPIEYYQPQYVEDSGFFL
jgi:hypothetical protein